MWHRVIWYKLVDYLEEHAASSFRIEEQDESSTVKMETAGLSETSINFPHNTRRSFIQTTAFFQRKVIKKCNKEKELLYLTLIWGRLVFV